MSENTLRKRIREEGITVYIDLRDKRVKLLDVAELRVKLQIRPLERGQEGKAAA